MTEKGPKLAVTQAEYARLRAVSRKSVTIYKQRGFLVFTDDGLVDVEASDAKLAERPESYRGGVTKDAPAVTPPADDDGSSSKDLTPPIFDQSIEQIAKQASWTTTEAVRIKENYLALLRRQEFEVEQGKLVEIEVIAKQVETEYSIVRERLLTLPGKIAASLVGCDRTTIESRLLDEISEALDELHDPGNPDDGGRKGGAPAS